MNRDGYCHSLWQDSTSSPSRASFSINEKLFDVIIVGAGITGITTALRLQQQGYSCLLAEAHNIGFGTTGGTTAHLNTVLDTAYHQIESDFDAATAKTVLKGTREAISYVENKVQEYAIDCGFAWKKACLLAVDEKQVKDLDKIADSSLKYGVNVYYTDHTDWPIPFVKAIEMDEQAQFHPTRYIAALAEVFEKAGGIIAESCRVETVTEDEWVEVKTNRGLLKSKFLIYATHIPPGVNILHFRCAPYRSYAISATLKSGTYPDSLAYDLNDPYYYFRVQEIDGQKYLIAGGEDHKTGHEENAMACFRKLESHVRKYFDISDIHHRWSSQYFEPADGLPYIGHLPGANGKILVATGYGGNGMIYGTLAGIILSDMITHGVSEYQEVFNPNRIKPIAGFSNFVKESADVVAHFIGDKIAVDKISSLSDLAPGEADVVKFEGHTIALCKREDGEVLALNAACTHINCNVAWNNAERSWDCPYHGSRFAADGTVLTGPARRDLERISLRELVADAAQKQAEQ